MVKYFGGGKGGWVAPKRTSFETECSDSSSYMHF